MDHFTFFRYATDKKKRAASLRNEYAGPFGSSCWLIGGGPSLKSADIELLNASPAPKMCINLAGTGLIRPTFWTSYDPTQRFLRSVYLNAGILKFVNRRRAMDLVSETSYKVCDCPGLYFFEGDQKRGFDDFLSPAHRSIVDWNDSMVQAIDILYQLGFRKIFLLGCEMRVSPSREMIEYAKKRNVEYRPEKLLGDFVKECEAKGICKAALKELQLPEQYHFNEQKSFGSAIATDFHYFRVAQFLRLSRQAISLAGLNLISVSPGSRLNDYFPVMSQQEASRQILRAVGDPCEEQIAGRYTDKMKPTQKKFGAMRDFQPLHWSEENKEVKAAVAKKTGSILSVKKENISKGASKKRFVDEADIGQDDLMVTSISQDDWVKEELVKMKKNPIGIEEIG